MSENVAGGTVETPETEINWEERAKKAEAKIVELKKTPKETTPEAEPVKEEPKGMSTDDFNAMYEERKFFENNSELAEHKDTLKDLVSKGNSWEDAKFLLERRDPTIAARQNTNSMDMSWDLYTPEKTTYTESEVEAIADKDQAAYNALMEKVDKGEAVIT